MKSLTLYKPNGEIFKTFPQIFAHGTENGLLSFRFERTPNDRNSIEKIITNLPFVLQDDEP
ncbi:MAG TPA: hypothetical protein VMU48_21655 [Terracidiphilus sp.]|nr:hypothetical protein [Terracidiphilus sp.]